MQVIPKSVGFATHPIPYAGDTVTEVKPDARCSLATEYQIERHRVGNGLGAPGTSMQMIAGIIFSFHMQGVCRIPEYRIEIDNGIEFAAGADPFIDLLSKLVALFGVISLERAAGERVFGVGVPTMIRTFRVWA